MIQISKNIWIGYQYIVYDLPNGDVKLELWMDQTNGLNGGNWVKVNERIDTGTSFAAGGFTCKAGVAAELKIPIVKRPNDREHRRALRPSLDTLAHPGAIRQACLSIATETLDRGQR